MKILVHGRFKPERHKVARVSCSACESLLEVEPGDLKEHEKRPNGSGIAICPVCGAQLVVLASQFTFEETNVLA